MPNYCECDLTVTGPVDELEAWLSVMDADNPCDVLIPYPEHFREKDANPPGYGDGYNSGGYEWCCENWGTKWGLLRVSLKAASASRVKHSFETAWAPPSAVVAEAALQFPTLKFDLRYYERGMGFKGRFTARGTDVTVYGTEKYTGTRGG